MSISENDGEFCNINTDKRYQSGLFMINDEFIRIFAKLLHFRSESATM